MLITTDRTAPEMGIAPAIIAAGISIAPYVLNWLSPSKSGPSAEEIAAMQAAAEAERKRKEQQQLLWGAGLLGVGVLAAVLISRG